MNGETCWLNDYKLFSILAVRNRAMSLMFVNKFSMFQNRYLIIVLLVLTE